MRIGQRVALRRCQRAGVIGVERQVEPAMAADRHGPVLARRGRAAELHTRAAGQRRAEQRVFAVDSLMAHPRNLFCQTLDQPIVYVGAYDLVHAAARRILDPDLAGAVDEDLGHRVAFEPFAERREIGIEINAALAVQVDWWRVLFRMVVRMEGMDIGAHVGSVLS